jgi:hypothetical protein
VSRMGHTASGITGHVRGWRSGVRVRAHVSAGVDVLDITLTAGEAGTGPDEHIGTVTLDAVTGRPTFVPEYLVNL